jgi:hypothetical protein
MGMAIISPYLKTGKRRTGGTFLELRTKPHLIYACFNEAGLLKVYRLVTAQIARKNIAFPAVKNG